MENISSFPSRTILKQQAIPVKITEEEVIITIKNPSGRKQFGPEGAKHSFIIQAVTAVFGKQVQKIVVRQPESGDNAIRKEQSSSDDDKPAPTPAESKSAERAKVKEEQAKEEVQAIETVKQVAQTPAVEPAQNVTQTQPKPDVEPMKKQKNYNDSASTFHSDGVNMVMDLFDGKFIE